ncbi:hypothetical protein BH23ACT9_BH23ACT9_17670 [soil metagenome]
MALAGPAPALQLPASPVTDLPAPATGLLDLGAEVLTSGNVTYHGTIPIDSPGIGGQVVFREDLGKPFFYATGLKGLSIYDISDPALPILTGTLPFPHAQNEDVKASADGTLVMIAADGSLLVPVSPVTTGITIIDVTDPTLPAIVASSNDRVMARGTAAGVAEHTAECAVADCSVIYGRTGRIYEVDTDAGTVTALERRWNTFIDPENGEERTTTQIHALDRDAGGLVFADSTPRLILDPLGQFDPASTPQNPTVLSTGERPARDPLQHNNRRPNAGEWDARDPEGEADDLEFVTVEPGDRVESQTDLRPVLRPGELLIGNSESNLNPGCNNAGGLSTWSIANFDQGQPMQSLEVFRPLSGTFLDGSPAVNALGCSGHWFTERDGLVTASWYEHGVRFFDIGLTNGTIEEIGFFQPLATEAGAAYWIDDEFVYSVDYARGIDIISFDRSAPRPSQETLDQAWITNLGVVSSFAQSERYICRLATIS